MTVALNDLFAVAAVGSCFNQRIMLTHHYAVSFVGSSTNEAVVTNDMVDALRGGGGGDAWETLYRALMPADWTLEYWQVQKIAPVRYAYQKASRGVAGTHAATTETANQSAILTLRTALAGRQDISNKHIGPIPQDAAVQVNGTLNAAYKTLLGNLGTAMLALLTGPATGTVWYPVVRHNTPPNSFTQVLTFATGDTVNTMRRRTVGRGI